MGASAGVGVNVWSPLLCALAEIWKVRGRREGGTEAVVSGGWEDGGGGGGGSGRVRVTESEKENKISLPWHAVVARGYIPIDTTL